MIYVSVDIETTGLDPEEDQVLEFGAVIDDGRPLDQLPCFHRYIKHDRLSGSPYALAMNYKIIEKIAKRDKIPITEALFCWPGELAVQFAEFLEKIEHPKVHVTFAGKNFGTFDLQFLQRLTNWKLCIKSRHRILDPALMYWEAGDDRLPDTKTCMERAELEGEVAHTALEDALMVVKLIRYKTQQIEGKGCEPLSIAAGS